MEPERDFFARTRSVYMFSRTAKEGLIMFGGLRFDASITCRGFQNFTHEKSRVTRSKTPADILKSIFSTKIDLFALFLPEFFQNCAKVDFFRLFLTNE